MHTMPAGVASGPRKRDYPRSFPSNVRSPTRSMAHTQLTEVVRSLVASTFADLGVAASEELRETILIREGSYCGRRFESPAAYAIWFVEENQIKVYQADGSLVRVIQPQEICCSARAAA